MERHSFHNDFQQIKQFKSKELVGIIRVGFAKEELKESPFVTKTNGLQSDMKMNVRFFDLSVIPFNAWIMKDRKITTL
jgi:hypothetical protein